MDGALDVQIRSMQHASADGPLIADLSFSVPANRIVSFLGPSGIGKTTLLRIIAGLERRYDGQVMLGGRPITRPTRDIQLVFQDYRLLPWKTVYENIQFARRPDAPDDRAEEWLRFVGLASRRDAWPKTLSGGEAGRVAFARAFVDQPKALLLDEPFSGLDVATRASLQDELVRALERQPATVVLISHSVEDAILLSDTIHILGDSPMRIERTLHVDIPRPRRRGDKRLVELAADVTGLITSRRFDQDAASIEERRQAAG